MLIYTSLHVALERYVFLYYVRFPNKLEIEMDIR
jgi:hypothetical protein